MLARDYWTSGAGLEHITPPGTTWPEGEMFKLKMTDLLFGQDMVDFGCGVGRLAELFGKKRYHGVDICPQAIEIAKSRNHGYNFSVIDDTSPIEGGYALLAHTVLLHVPDDQLERVLMRFTQRRIIVSEVTGKEWRRSGNPPVFNRSYGDYERAFNVAGYRLHSVKFWPYPHYSGTDLTVMEFHRDN